MYNTFEIDFGKVQSATDISFRPNNEIIISQMQNVFTKKQRRYIQDPR